MSDRDRGRPDSRGRGRRDRERPPGPVIPDDVAASDLEGEVRRDLLTLDKANADSVARHLVMVSRLLDENPLLALEHARAARGRASRVGVVRETVGVAAYTAGEWQEAITELRAARRITGNSALLPLIADAERGLGRPERAIEIARGDDGRALTGDEATEMRIVEAGARMDLGDAEKAIVTLQAEDLRPGQTGTMPARLFYAYASALEAAGRTDDAVTWFMNAAAADVDDVTDAEFRLTEIAEGTAAPADSPENETEGTALAAESGALPVETGEPSAESAAVPVETSTPATDSTLPPAESPAPPAEGSAPVVYDAAVPVESPAVESPAVESPAVESPAVPMDSTPPKRRRTLADSYDALLLDLDGTVFAGHRALPHAVDSLARTSTARFFVTNNASRRPAEVAAHLTDLGFDATPDLVVTSAQSAARLLSEHLEPGSRALVIGTDGLAQEVREAGIGVTRSADDRPAAVIQGHSPETGWAQLSEAALAIRAGALWIATNVDATLPSERGLLVGNGSMVAAVRNATGAEPIVAGKPAAPLMADAIARSRARKPLVVGDRLDTDIEGAHAVGIDSALVLTGVSTVPDLLIAPPEQRPTYVIDDLAGLFDDPERVRVGPQPGWNVEVFDSHVVVTPDDDAAAVSMVPAVVHAIWAAIDGTDVDADTLSVAAGDAATQERLAVLGIPS
ncbi:HAD-IIA family hydrolase [Gordonia bronchialis]|uniref:HAD-IIA family hydrolase n=1 Tax=Gordonia bronchialis TaxID=2054 RepID=UPI00242E535F|nr:HAD-IIA family hydrolase [Gordonia bronchialis]